MAGLVNLSWQLLHVAAGSFLLLALGALLVRCCVQPVNRIRVIEWTFCGCLLLPLFQVGGWLPSVKLGVLPPEVNDEVQVLAIPPTEDTTASEPERVPFLEEAFVPQDAAAPPENLATAPPAVVPVAESIPADSVTNSAEVSAAREVREPAVPAASRHWPVWLLGTYVIGVVVLALRFAWAFVLRRRLAKAVQPAPRELMEMFRSLAQVSTRERLASRVRLGVSDRVTSPITWGLFRPVIVVPQSWLAGSSEQLRSGLAHEWSHIERRDFRGSYLAAIVEIGFYYQPLYWWLKRRLQLSQDQLADSLAHTEFQSAADYAELLINLARRERVVPLPGTMGILSSYSRLYRRIQMLLTTNEPLHRRCRRSFDCLVVSSALLLSIGLSALSFESLPAQETEKPANKQETEKPKPEQPEEKAAQEPYTYKGQVLDRVTNEPIEGVEVEVELSLTRDPKTKKGENRKLRSIIAKTDAQGKYDFTITGEEHAQSSLYIVVDAKHPNYAPKGRSGYAHSMIQKNMRLGEPPFFSEIKLWPGEPIVGTVVDPAGEPLSDVEILTYAASDRSKERFLRGSFGKARTDKNGRFQIVVATPGDGVLWITPDEYCPQAHRIKDRRGDWGRIVAVKGTTVNGKVLDARGNVVPNIMLDVRRRGDGEEADGFLNQNAVANHIGRQATTDPNGEFRVASLPEGEYRVRVRTVDSETREPIPGAPVFLEKSFTIPDDKETLDLEVQAVPHVLIQGQVVDSQGKPTSGHGFHVFGRVSGDFYFGQSNDPGKDGKLEARVPHGLEKAQISLMTNEHGVLRWRLDPNDSLKNGRRIEIDLLEEDLTTLEIVHYVAPILIVKAVDEDGKLVPDYKPKAVYEKDSPKDPNSRFISGVNGDVNFEKQPDGRWRSSQLIPDQKLTLTVEKEGFETEPQELSLEEKAEKEIVFVLKKKAE